jgi:hypothetical protein
MAFVELLLSVEQTKLMCIVSFRILDFSCFHFRLPIFINENIKMRVYFADVDQRGLF